jgi:hypothetical protein
MSPIATSSDVQADPQAVLQMSDTQKAYMLTVFNEFLTNYVPNDPVISTDTSDTQDDFVHTTLLASVPYLTAVRIDPVETVDLLHLQFKMLLVVCLSSSNNGLKLPSREGQNSGSYSIRSAAPA